MSNHIPIHIPVLVDEIINYYQNIPQKKEYYFIDCTAGEGGHTKKLIETFPTSKVLMVDRDKKMLEMALKRLSCFGERVSGIPTNFSELSSFHIKNFFQNERVHGILIDLGISMYHLEGSGKGFSIKYDEPLEMNLDEECDISASEVVNKYSPEQLYKIFKEYGQENWSKKIVEKIVEHRKKNPIETTKELAKIVEKTIPRRFWPPKAHPATRIFQAIRIEVNKELEHIQIGLENIIKYLDNLGILCVISFHSLEDRIVKNFMKNYTKNFTFKLLTKKPIQPTPNEITQNRASRSAKLRVLQKGEAC